MSHEAAAALLINHSRLKRDWKDIHGHTPLSLAAVKGHESFMMLQLNRFNVDSKNNCGRTPLHLASDLDFVVTHLSAVRYM